MFKDYVGNNNLDKIIKRIKIIKMQVVVVLKLQDATK